MPQLPITHNFTIYKGTTFRKGITWKLGDPPLPMDLTGYGAAFTASVSRAELESFINLSTQNGGIEIANPTAGKLRLVLTAEQTSALVQRSGEYELRLISPSGDVFSFMRGKISIF